MTRFRSTSNSLSDDELLGLAASLESHSEHPIATGILKKAKTSKLELREPINFKNITGKGIKGTVNGSKTEIVSPGMLQEYGITPPSGSLPKRL